MLPALILEHYRRGNRHGKVKVTMLKVTWLLRSRVRDSEKKQPKVTIQALSHKLHLPLRFHWELREAGLKAANTIPEHSSNQNDWEKYTTQTFLQTEQRLNINRYWTSLSPSELPAPSCPFSAPKMADQPGPPCPLVSSCAWSLEIPARDWRTERRGDSIYFSAPVPTYHLLSPWHYSFASSFCTNSHSCSFTPVRQSLSDTQVPAAIIPLPWCPLPPASPPYVVSSFNLCQLFTLSVSSVSLS